MHLGIGASVPDRVGHAPEPAFERRPEPCPLAAATDFELDMQTPGAGVGIGGGVWRRGGRDEALQLLVFEIGEERGEVAEVEVLEQGVDGGCVAKETGLAVGVELMADLRRCCERLGDELAFAPWVKFNARGALDDEEDVLKELHWECEQRGSLRARRGRRC